MPPPSCPSEYKPGLTVSHYYRDFSHSPPVVLLASVLRCFPHPTRHLASTTRQVSRSLFLLNSCKALGSELSMCLLVPCLRKFKWPRLRLPSDSTSATAWLPAPVYFSFRFLFYSYFIPILFQDSPTILFYRASVPTFIVTEATLSPTVHTE